MRPCIAMKPGHAGAYEMLMNTSASAHFYRIENRKLSPGGDNDQSNDNWTMCCVYLRRDVDSCGMGTAFETAATSCRSSPTSLIWTKRRLGSICERRSAELDPTRQSTQLSGRRRIGSRASHRWHRFDPGCRLSGLVEADAR